MPKGKRGQQPKPVYCITLDREFESGKKAGEILGIPANGISDVCNGKLYKTHKMRFCFVADKDKFADEIAVVKANAKVKVKVRLIRKGVR